MAKGTSDDTPTRKGRKPRGSAFRPTQAQRAFVAAAAGLGVPYRVICQMLPGARPGETVSISGHQLRDYFGRELREGMKLVTALVGARLCQRALSGDDRGALQAQMLILNARGGWKLPDERAEDPDEPLSMDALNREERNELERLITKAMGGDDAKKAALSDAATRPGRRTDFRAG